jgi:hypothetical protein
LKLKNRNHVSLKYTSIADIFNIPKQIFRGRVKKKGGLFPGSQVLLSRQVLPSPFFGFLPKFDPLQAHLTLLTVQARATVWAATLLAPDSHLLSDPGVV